MSSRILALSIAGLLALGAAPAAAQDRVAGAAGYKLKGGLATEKMRYYAPAQQVVMRGRVTPAVPGEILTLHAIRRGNATKKIRRTVRKGGRFEFAFKVGKPGLVRLVVKHRRSAAQQAFRTARRMIQVVDWQAGAGERGLKVLLLQRALIKEGYATPVTGSYDDATARGVLAFRKTNEMGRDGYALKEVFAMLMRGEGAYRLRYPSAGENGKHVEFDWSRQVLVLARGGKPYRTYHTSSGAPATPTVFGSYRFYLQTPGTNSLGMVHSSYFIGGYAIHGYRSVPSYPASHGCLRVPIPNARSIFDWIDIGDPIFTYR
ncbi:MAG TPA: L,D-transpeptidase [Thermoleophilaceae bacterium]|nr:L,D-transpeptidase [Thermoleophilaceae bacterium]